MYKCVYCINMYTHTWHTCTHHIHTHRNAFFNVEHDGSSKFVIINLPRVSTALTLARTRFDAVSEMVSHLPESCIGMHSRFVIDKMPFEGNIHSLRKPGSVCSNWPDGQLAWWWVVLTCQSIFSSQYQTDHEVLNPFLMGDWPWGFETNFASDGFVSKMRCYFVVVQQLALPMGWRQGSLFRKKSFAPFFVLYTE